MPTAAELTTYYNSAYSVPRERYLASVDREFPVMYRLVERSHPRPGRLLEIGCSYGAMLARFASRGWAVEGVELDARSATYARGTLGVDVHHGRLEDALPLLRAPYDVVAMYHVLEHVDEPDTFARTLASLVAPGGTLVLKTPNASSLASRTLGGWWEWSAVPEHLHLYTPRSLARLLGQGGFDVETVTTRRGDAHEVLFELARAWGRRIAGRPPRGEVAVAAGETARAIEPPTSQQAAYVVAARVLGWAGRPAKWLLSAFGALGGTPGSELVASARRR